jgi:hypothetical protein
MYKKFAVLGLLSLSVFMIVGVAKDTSFFSSFSGEKDVVANETNFPKFTDDVNTLSEESLDLHSADADEGPDGTEVEQVTSPTADLVSVESYSKSVPKEDPNAVTSSNKEDKNVPETVADNVGELAIFVEQYTDQIRVTVRYPAGDDLVFTVENVLLENGNLDEELLANAIVVETGLSLGEIDTAIEFIKTYSEFKIEKREGIDDSSLYIHVSSANGKLLVVVTHDQDQEITFSMDEGTTAQELLDVLLLETGLSVDEFERLDRDGFVTLKSVDVSEYPDRVGELLIKIEHIIPDMASSFFIDADIGDLDMVAAEIVRVTDFAEEDIKKVLRVVE